MCLEAAVWIINSRFLLANTLGNCHNIFSLSHGVKVNFRTSFANCYY